MERDIQQKLTRWRQRKNRKPLVLYGLRQVGKTFSLKQLGATFRKTHYFNFEEDSALAKIFTPDLNPQRILAELSFKLNTVINKEQDFVIFDEIQACPLALTSLKYFCENMPELALAAAGSLLGVHLTPGSFPVGKVELLTLHPMTLTEFLSATNKTMQAEFLSEVTPSTTITESIHQQLWQSLKTYFVVGGMPEVVAEFATLQEEDYYSAIIATRLKQTTLITTYLADVAKHSGKVNAMHIDRIWRAVPATLARAQDGSATKFKFKDIIPGIDRYTRMAHAIDWLVAAGLVIKVPIVKTGLLPLSAYTEESAFKLYMPDVGLLGALAQLPPKAILDYDYGTYKGYFAENFVAQELLAKDKSLYAWQEGKAEVEFLCEVDAAVIPIEVKSGWVTKSQSLQRYAEKYRPPYRVIFSARPLSLNQHIHHYPLYLAEQFPL